MAKPSWAKYFAPTKQRHAFTLLLAVFFAMSVHAGKELPKPAIGEQGQIATSTIPDKKPLAPVATPSDVAIVPVNPAQATSDQPVLPGVDKPVADSPITRNSSGAMADLPASKRLAISVLAGVFTLLAALWIGARRD